MAIHLPVTPAWTCGGCGADWPCQTRRRELRAEYDQARVSLALYLKNERAKVRIQRLV